MNPSTIGVVITWIARPAFFIPIGGNDDDGGHPIAALLTVILAPIAALLIQMAISPQPGVRRRLLRGLAHRRPTGPGQRPAQDRGLLARHPAGDHNPSTAHLFISNPFRGGDGVASLFSTHPSTAERAERLERMAYNG